MKNISKELRTHESTLNELKQFQAEILKRNSSGIQTQQWNTFPEEYTKLLCAFVQDSPIADLDVLLDEIMNEWKKNLADNSIIDPFPLNRDVLKLKIDAISTLENYGVVDVPEYSLLRREVIHVTHLPKDIREGLKERRKEYKNIRKNLRNMYKEVAKLKREMARLELQLQKQLSIIAKQQEKIKKQEEKEQKKKEKEQEMKKKSENEKKKKNISAGMDISKFATKMKIPVDDAVVTLTGAKPINHINMLSEEQIDQVLSGVLHSEPCFQTSIALILSEMKKLNLKHKYKNTGQKKFRAYVYSKAAIDNHDKVYYVKRFSNEPIIAFDGTDLTPKASVKPRTYARRCWKQFLSNVDYDEPCYESLDEEEDDVDGEDIMDEEEDEKLFPGMEDYDEDEDHDFVVHDGYVSEEDLEESSTSDDDLLDDVQVASKKKKTFDREENIALKRRAIRKRGKAGIELVTLDTQHYIFNDNRMDKFESILAQPSENTLEEIFDFSDLPWLDDERKHLIEPSTPSKKRETAHVVLAEYKIPEELQNEKDCRTQWKQYIHNNALRKLAAFADGYEGAKQKLIDDFIDSYQQAKDKKDRVTKVIVRKQLEEIVYKSERQISLESNVPAQQQNRALFKVYSYVLDVVKNLPENEEESGEPEDGDVEMKEPGIDEVTNRNEQTPKRKRRIYHRSISTKKEEMTTTPKKDRKAKEIQAQPKKKISYQPSNTNTPNTNTNTILENDQVPNTNVNLKKTNSITVYFQAKGKQDI
jgi:hypothetical protein